MPEQTNPTSRFHRLGPEPAGLGEHRASRTACPQLARVAARASALAIYRNVLSDETGRAFMALLECLASPNDAGRILQLYSRVLGLLAEEAELYPDEMVGDAWQNHLLDRVLADENAFSLKCQRAATDQLGPGLVTQVRRELRALQCLFSMDAQSVRLAVQEVLAQQDGLLEDEPLGTWGSFCTFGGSPPPHSHEARRLKRRLASAADWGDLVEELAEYYFVVGAGLFSRFLAFRWVRRGGEGRLEGVVHHDPVTLQDLVGYDLEREPLIHNTEIFVAGFPANSVLLYGDRGTGKSSTIKALLNAYGNRGLRLIEVPKELLGDLPQILPYIRHRRERFILFVDDLSFDEHETAYKALKATLEGGLEARPDNVVVYATSNRRHLVQERFSDRDTSPDAELHPEDTAQEKLSLADRFGIRVTFLSPDQGRYLAIVEELARRRGIDLPLSELHRGALQWARRYNGRSGRTARQFIDHLYGSLRLGLVERASPTQTSGG